MILLACEICTGYSTRGKPTKKVPKKVPNEAVVMQDTTFRRRHVFMCGEHAAVFGLGKVTLDLRALYLTEGSNA